MWKKLSSSPELEKPGWVSAEAQGAGVMFPASMQDVFLLVLEMGFS